MSVSNFPLAWPPGWKRTTTGRKDAQFINRDKRYIGIVDGVHRVLDELRRLGVKEDDVIISTNVRPTLGGRATEGTGKIPDPGVCVYWKAKSGEQRCIAVDRYTGVAGNLGAVAATLEAMRAIERHGGAEILERAFTGFTALPGPEQPWEVLGISSQATKEEVDKAYKRLAHKHHPDRGGDAEQMTRINRARDALLDS
jgi:hypothetical protein